MDTFDDFNDIPGAFMIFKADFSQEEIIYTNDSLINMFNCNDLDDFNNYTNKSFKGIIIPSEYNEIENQLKLLIRNNKLNYFHVNFHIVDKTFEKRMVDAYFKFKEIDGIPYFYTFLVDSMSKVITSNFDSVTELPKENRFEDYAKTIIMNMKDSSSNQKCAILYLDLISFKNYEIKFGKKASEILLKDISDTIIEIFSFNIVARVNDYNFTIFTVAKNLNDKLNTLNEEIKERHSLQKTIIKIGIYTFYPNDDIKVIDAIENAKKACDSIKESDTIFYKVYDDEMQLNQRIYDYVTTKLDSAIKSGEIIVYYQPVVRTLNEKLASAEALVRWNSKEFGMMPPYKFIEPLEKTRQIDRLDSFVFDEICKLLRFRMDNNLDVVPISFNLSRLDFVLMDPYNMVINTVNKYQIPHKLIKVEITETVIMLNPEQVKAYIKKFRDSGFDVWMDDFGSAYSSLNMLKDFDLDEIKLDMAFIKELNDKSKTIIKNLITMSKELGVETLAEGVETKEQYDFLRSIGCEKVQGYLFSKPVPFGELEYKMKQQNISFEEAKYREFYQSFKGINFLTDLPIAIVLKEDLKYNVLFMNQQIKDVLTSVDLGSEIQFNNLLNDELTTIRQLLSRSNNLPNEVNQKTSFVHSYKANVFNFTITCVSKKDNDALFIFNISNLKSNEVKTNNRLKTSLFEISQIYSSIAYVDTKEDKFEPICEDHNVKESFNDLKYSESIEQMKNYIFKSDLDTFLKFCNPQTLIRRCSKDNQGYTIKPFRFIQDNKVYWRYLVFVLVSKQQQKFVLLTRNLTEGETVFYNNFYKLKENGTISESELNNHILIRDILHSIENNSDYVYFFKDIKKHYISASKKFLQLYNIKNITEIIGKTDDELGWDISNEKYKEKEQEVIKENKVCTNVPFIGITNGISRVMLANIYPISSSGVTTGLFVTIKTEEDKDMSIAYLDHDTYLLNIKGFIESFIQYYNEYKYNNKQFVIINVKLTRLEEVANSIGIDFAKKCEAKVAKMLKEDYGFISSISHIKFGSFALLKQYDDLDNKKLKDEISNKIYQINNIDGVSVTLFNDISITTSIDGKSSMLKSIILDNIDDIK